MTPGRHSASGRRILLNHCALGRYIQSAILYDIPSALPLLKATRFIRIICLEVTGGVTYGAPSMSEAYQLRSGRSIYSVSCFITSELINLGLTGRVFNLKYTDHPEVHRPPFRCTRPCPARSFHFFSNLVVRVRSVVAHRTV